MRILHKLPKIPIKYTQNTILSSNSPKIIFIILLIINMHLLDQFTFKATINNFFLVIL